MMCTAISLAALSAGDAAAQTCDMDAPENQLVIASTDGVNHATAFLVAESEVACGTDFAMKQSAPGTERADEGRSKLGSSRMA